MDDTLKKIKEMTMEEFFQILSKYESYEKEKKHQDQLYQCIFNPKNEVDYELINQLLPNLNQDDFSFLLKYDKDYSISFLLSIVNLADEDDLTKQAIFLLKRHNLSYIIPLLPYVDEEEIQEAYSFLNQKKH